VRVRKAVVLAAGYGTRLLPATKAQPKESLPLVDKPIIQYAVEEAVAAGITQVIIVTAASKRAVEDHFDRSLELEQALGQRATRRPGSVASATWRIVYVRQKEQLGIGHAVLTVRGVVGRAVRPVLPDDVIVSEVQAARRLINVFEAQGSSVLALEEVPPRGAELRRGRRQADREGLWRVRGLVEKPSVVDAPSNLAVVGRYVLTPEIFEALDETPPGKGGEIQITDGLANLLKRQPMFAYRFEGSLRYQAARPRRPSRSAARATWARSCATSRLTWALRRTAHPRLAPLRAAYRQRSFVSARVLRLRRASSIRALSRNSEIVGEPVTTRKRRAG
jgi:UTP--glucose-1-phosphate uridylyltransferase